MVVFALLLILSQAFATPQGSVEVVASKWPWEMDLRSRLTSKVEQFWTWIDLSRLTENSQNRLRMLDYPGFLTLLIPARGVGTKVRINYLVLSTLITCVVLNTKKALGYELDFVEEFTSHHHWVELFTFVPAFFSDNAALIARPFVEYNDFGHQLVSSSKIVLRHVVAAILYGYFGGTLVGELYKKLWVYSVVFMIVAGMLRLAVF